MMRRWRALPCAALLGLHLVVAGGGGLLDATLERAGDVPIHIEEAGDHPCDRGHDHQRCVVCRTLSLQGVPAAPARTAVAPATRVHAERTPAASAAARQAHGLHHSRAPPAVPAIA